MTVFVFIFWFYLYVAVLRKAFDAFDRERSGSIPTDMVADILRLMGQPFNKKILDELIEEVDADSEYRTHSTSSSSVNKPATGGVR